MKYVLVALICLAGCNSYDSTANDTTLWKASSIPGVVPCAVAEFVGFVEDPVICSKVARWMNEEEKQGGYPGTFYCAPKR